MPVEPISPLPTLDCRRSWIMAGILAGALLLGVLVKADTERATLFGLEGPHCLLGSAIGETACPGCGLTRSTALLLDGEWGEATRVHPACWVVVMGCFFGLLVHLDILRRGRRTSVHRTILSVGHGVFVTGLTAAWLLRLISLV